jgi:uncharacterized membrane protein
VRRGGGGGATTVVELIIGTIVLFIGTVVLPVHSDLHIYKKVVLNFYL